jgi:hypothetical protein
MTRLELASCCTLAAFAVLSTSAAAAPAKKPKPGAWPAVSAAPPAASSSAPPPAPAPPPSARPATASDEESASVGPSTQGDKKITVGADLLFVLPFGSLSNVSGPQIGPLLRVGYRIIPPLELTGRIGYLFAFGKTQNINGNNVSTSVADIPVWLGARYFVIEAPAGPYAAAEIGMNFLTAQASATITGQSQSQSTGDTRAGFNLGVGYVLSKDLPIDVRLQYSYLNLIGAGTNEGALWGIGLSAGYSFFF